MANTKPPTFGTRTDLADSLKLPALTPKQKCESKGGFWDEATQSCLLVPPKPKPSPKPPKVKASGIETFKGEKGISGVTLPNGKTYLGLSKADVEALSNKEQQRTAQPIGTAPIGTAQAEADKQFRLQQQIAKIGQVGPLTTAQEADINFSQAATAGAARVIPGLVGGAATGALIGGIAGGGVGSTITAPAGDRKSTRLNSSHIPLSRMPSSA